MLALGRFCSNHRRLVLTAWIAVLFGVGAAWQAAGSHYANNFTLGHTGAQRAADLLASAFPAQAGDSDQIVFHARSGAVGNASTRTTIEQMLDKVSKLPHVTSVVSPFAADAGNRISPDGKTAFATVLFDERANVLPTKAIQHVIDTATAIRSPALEVELGGQAIEQTEFAKPASTTGIGLLAAMIVLLVSFGSFLAMGLPIVTALFGLGTGIGLVGLVSHVLDMPSFSIELGAMIGLGVGIDYALFILSRFREVYAENGKDVRGAVEVAMDTAGRAVLFAGATVVIALLGMFALGVSFLYGLAIAASLAVLLVLAASVTLLPALLTFFGRRVGEPGRLARFFRPRRPGHPRAGFWTRWAATIQRRPWLAGGAALLLMLVLAVPALSLRLGSSDAGNDPPSFTTKRAYDLLAQGLGPGFNGPLLLVVKLPHTGDTAPLGRLADEVAEGPGSGFGCTAPAEPGRKRGDDQRVPDHVAAEQRHGGLVKHLRSDTIPPLEQTTGATIFVGGPTATFIDFSSVLSAKLWLFIGVVVLLSALLLLVVFRSLLIPLQAALMNLLSIASALGVVVAAFQFGWLPGMAPGPIDAFVPVLMFAIVFGLSMDYEVFLVSRIHEEWERGRDAHAAVRNGLVGTGRVITAAASVMVVVFASFMFGGERVIELFGLGLATAVFLDAFVIRLVLLPAVLHLLGARAWYFPGWLGRRLPRLALEHEGPIAPAFEES